MRIVMGPALFAGFLLSACAETAVAPGEGGRLAGSIAVGDMTVQTLPIPKGWQGASKTVSANGAVFATNDGLAARPLVAWLPPYTSQPLVVATTGAVGAAGAANAGGDVVSFDPVGGGPSGARLQATPTSWAFVADAQSYTTLSSRVINDTREMAGYVRVPLSMGGTELRAVYFPAPGAEPVLLPKPGIGTFGGTMVNGMNNAGDIVGYAIETAGGATYLRATLWRRLDATNWSVELLPPHGLAASSSAYGINDLGQITGGGDGLVRWTPDGSGGWTREQIAPSGSATQIDACGRVVGTVAIGRNDRAFVWDGDLNLLPLPGSATRSGGNDITTDATTGRGVIVGWAAKGGMPSYPVRWTIPGCP